MIVMISYGHTRVSVSVMSWSESAERQGQSLSHTVSFCDVTQYLLGRLYRPLCSFPLCIGSILYWLHRAPLCRSRRKRQTQLWSWRIASCYLHVSCHVRGLPMDGRDMNANIFMQVSSGHVDHTVSTGTKLAYIYDIRTNLCLCLCLHLHLHLYLYLYISISLYLYISISLYLYLYISISISISIFICIRTSTRDVISML